MQNILNNFELALAFAKHVPVYSWLNLLLLTVTGYLLIKLNRWKYMPWLRTYVIGAVGLSLWYYVFYYGNYDAFLVTRYVGYVLIIGAVYDIIRHDFADSHKMRWFTINLGDLDKETIALERVPFWILPALLIIPLHTITAAFVNGYWHNGFPWFYIPRAVLFIGLAAQFFPAKNVKHYPLMAFGFLGVGICAVDFFKMFKVGTIIYRIQLTIDPWVFTAFAGILCYGILQPALARKFALFARPKEQLQAATDTNIIPINPFEDAYQSEIVDLENQISDLASEVKLLANPPGALNGKFEDRKWLSIDQATAYMGLGSDEETKSLMKLLRIPIRKKRILKADIDGHI
jgi:hypothetical protein